MKMEENNKHVQPNSKEEGVQRLNRILSESLIKATDTYKTPPQIIWVDNSSIATLGNFSASTGKAKAKKTFNVSALVASFPRQRQGTELSRQSARGETQDTVCRYGAEPLSLP